MPRKKPDGVASLVQEDPVELQEMHLVDLFACFCMLNSVTGDDPQREAEWAYDRAYAMIDERRSRL
jgi:hypothetical protein